MGGWSYNPAAFVYPDPQFNSVVMTEAGPLTLRPLGSAIDGDEPRAELTEDGVELLSTAADEEDLEWEINGQSELTLEPAGSDVVVVAPGGEPAAIVHSISSGNVNVVDGEMNTETGESNNTIVLEPEEAYANASVVPLSESPGNFPVCITKADAEAAAVVHEEAMAQKAELIGPKASGGGGGTTPVTVWINLIRPEWRVGNR